MTVAPRELTGMEASRVARCTGEFLGTFVLVFTICCNLLAEQATAWAGVSAASVLVALIYALGGVSGAHLNPAVSLSVGLAGKATWEDSTWFVGMQVLGGLAAGLVTFVFFGRSVSLEPSHGHNFMQACVAELLYTLMLCLVVLNVACSKMHGGRNQFYGVAIGFVFLAAAYGGGSISMGVIPCLNPAIALGIDVTSWSLLPCVACQLLGGVLAARLYPLIRPEDDDEATAAPMPRCYKLRSRLVAEGLGTYFLMLTFGLCSFSRSQAGPLAVGAALMSMAFAFGSVSGGHFNPAVTVAVNRACRETLSNKDCSKYMSAQTIGSICGALTSAMLVGNWSMDFGPRPPYSLPQALSVEVLYTFVLAFVVLCVTSAKAPLTEYYAFAIGSAVTAAGFAIGGVSGGVLNPALTVGSMIARLPGGGGIVFSAMYVVGQAVGGGLAVLAFKATRVPEEKEPTGRGSSSLSASYGAASA